MQMGCIHPRSTLFNPFVEFRILVMIVFFLIFHVQWLINIFISSNCVHKMIFSLRSHFRQKFVVLLTPTLHITRTHVSRCGPNVECRSFSFNFMLVLNKPYYYHYNMFLLKTELDWGILVIILHTPSTQYGYCINKTKN